MKALIRRVIGSRKSIYLTALAAALFLISACWILSFANAAGVAFIFFVLAVLCTSFSWISFVYYSTTMGIRQISTSVAHAMSKRAKKIEEALHKTVEEYAEVQAKEYKTQALNTLIKLDQLQGSLYANIEGSHED